MKGDIIFSPVSMEEPIRPTREQLKFITALAETTPAFIEVYGHNPSTTVEVYVDPLDDTNPVGSRYHLSADGTYDMETGLNVDGEYDWTPV